MSVSVMVDISAQHTQCKTTCIQSCVIHINIILRMGICDKVFTLVSLCSKLGSESNDGTVLQNFHK